MFSLFSGSPMLGERERDREAVQWELGDATTPPFNNGGPQQQHHSMDGVPCGYQMSYGGGVSGIGVIGDDGQITTNTNYGGQGSATGGVMSAAGVAGKEVRYAPLPNTQLSPTHSNPISQAPLQRAHSRYDLSMLTAKCCGLFWLKQCARMC